MLTLLLAGLPIHKEVFIALEVLYFLFSLGACLLLWKAIDVLKHRSPSPLPFILGLPLLVLEPGLVLAYRGRWPVDPYTFGWWNFIGLALTMMVMGGVFRHNADSLIEDSSD